MSGILVVMHWASQGSVAQPNVCHPFIRYPLQTLAKLFTASYTLSGVYRIAVAQCDVRGTDMRLTDCKTMTRGPNHSTHLEPANIICGGPAVTADRIKDVAHASSCGVAELFAVKVGGTCGWEWKCGARTRIKARSESRVYHDGTSTARPTSFCGLL